MSSGSHGRSPAPWRRPFLCSEKNFRQYHILGNWASGYHGAALACSLLPVKKIFPKVLASGFLYGGSGLFACGLRGSRVRDVHLVRGGAGKYSTSW